MQAAAFTYVVLLWESGRPARRRAFSLLGLDRYRALRNRVDAAAQSWTFTATPYVWFAGLKGDLGTISGLPPAEVDASFSDIIENTDVALMLAAEARRDRWGLLLDLVYSIYLRTRTRRSLFSGRRPRIRNLVRDRGGRVPGGGTRSNECRCRSRRAALVR
jgi:hypothetical protein